METLDLIKKAFEYLKEDLTYFSMSAIVSADKVAGSKQECDSEYFDHEFVDQYCSFEDDYHGNIYLPLPNGEYMEFNFQS